jgi:hypothetical protein
MPTQEEIDNVLAKVTTYQGKKAISDAAQKTSDTASQRANAARSAFDAMVADGETDEEKLTTVLVAVSETGQDASIKQADASTKSTEASQAYTQWSDALSALTIPPSP